MTDDQFDEKILRQQVLDSVRTYYRHVHEPMLLEPFAAGSKIPYAGRVYDEQELVTLTESALDFWLTSGRYSSLFEKKLAEFLKVRYVALTNSGSSANLLAFMALTSSELGERRIRRGDEVITVAAGFPTTISPMIQYGAVPVFVDVEIPSYNIDVRQLELALSPKTKAVMIAHTLGNPFDIKTVKEFCERHQLWLVEDNCDALGSLYFYNQEWNYTGTFGDIGTSSFYPPHHITMGEGGAVYTNNPRLKRLIESFRDWGRDCWCDSGKDNTCHMRFGHQMGELPFGYDHKYVYSHFGYNLKATDMQAAIGIEQLNKLPTFIEQRRRNWDVLHTGLKPFENYFILPAPAANSEPSWFAFIITVRQDAPFGRNDVVKFLEDRFIQTRMLFAGNIIKHPCFDELRYNQNGYRVVGDLTNTDVIMNQSFLVGVYPGMKPEQIQFIIDTFQEFLYDGGLI